MSDARPTKPVQIDVKLTPEEHARFIRITSARSPAVRFLRVIAALIVLGFVAGLFLGVGIDRYFEQPVVATVTLTVPLMVFVVLPIMAPRTARQRWEGNPAIREMVSYTFSGDGVQMVGETWDATLSWSNILSVEQVGGLILLGRGPNMFTLIPSRAFESAADLERFRDLVRANVRDCQL